MHCSAMQYSAQYYSAMHYSAMQFSAMQYSAMQYSAMHSIALQESVSVTSSLLANHVFAGISCMKKAVIRGIKGS